MNYSYIFTVYNSFNIFKILPNVKSTLTGKNGLKLNLFEFVLPKPEMFIEEKFAASYVDSYLLKFITGE